MLLQALINHESFRKLRVKSLSSSKLFLSFHYSNFNFMSYLRVKVKFFQIILNQMILSPCKLLRFLVKAEVHFKPQVFRSKRKLLTALSPLFVIFLATKTLKNKLNRSKYFIDFFSSILIKPRPFNRGRQGYLRSGKSGHGRIQSLQCLISAIPTVRKV